MSKLGMLIERLVYPCERRVGGRIVKVEGVQVVLGPILRIRFGRNLRIKI
jgi:hypothetical protein